MEFEVERQHVGEGWQELIVTVHTALTALLGEYEIHQIKEKFGGLRYYWGAPGAEDDALIAARAVVDTAEARSFHICELCGKEGSARAIGRFGWVHTLCDEHHAEREAEVAQREASHE